MDHNIKEKVKNETSYLNEYKPSSKKGLVVEFVGQVGCGKTTNCNYFSELLKENGFVVYMLSDLKYYFHNMNYRSKFYIILSTLFFKGVDLLRFTLVLARHRIFSLDSIIRYSKLCVMNQVLRQFLVKRIFDVLLLDQWIIQGLWSATIFKLNSYDVLHEKLRRFYFKTDIILYFNIDIETALERIESRDTFTSRFDKMDAGKRSEELKKYDTYLLQLYENSNCKNKLEFSALANPEKNAEDFLNQLKKKITYE